MGPRGIISAMDIQKTMEFILTTQAKLEVSVQQQAERSAELQALVKGHEERFAKLETSIATVTDLVGRLAQAQIQTVERMDSGFRELKEALISTDYKLNALIETVDKLVHRNGHKE